MSAPLQLQFVTSAGDVADLPATTAEIAVVGRSNVGKSSLLNALANRRDLARVSKTPGRTQLLNCFRVQPHGTMVDLPGYGYAKTSAANRTAWRTRMEQYLLQREGLRRTLLLVDGEVGPTRLDEEMLAWLRENGVSFVVVATKHDKVKSSRRERRKREVAEGCGVARGEVVWVSAETGVGVPRLRTLVREILEQPERVG